MTAGERISALTRPIEILQYLPQWASGLDTLDQLAKVSVSEALSVLAKGGQCCCVGHCEHNWSGWRAVAGQGNLLEMP